MLAFSGPSRRPVRTPTMAPASRVENKRMGFHVRGTLWQEPSSGTATFHAGRHPESAPGFRGPSAPVRPSSNNAWEIEFATGGSSLAGTGYPVPQDLRIRRPRFPVPTPDFGQKGRGPPVAGRAF